MVSSERDPEPQAWTGSAGRTAWAPAVGPVPESVTASWALITALGPYCLSWETFRDWFLQGFALIDSVNE